jgi:hypothetical protein
MAALKAVTSTVVALVDALAELQQLGELGQQNEHQQQGGLEGPVVTPVGARTKGLKGAQADLQQVGELQRQGEL